MKNLFLLLASILLFHNTNAQNNCNNYWSVVSPDGNYIYFNSNRLGNTYNIFRCDIDGKNTVIITDSEENDYYPSLNPEGDKIVFQRGDYNNKSEIFIIDSDGKNLTQLTSNNVYDGYPNFSPDGKTIVFDAWDGSNYPEIFTMKPDGTNRIQITNFDGAYWQSAPIYNPDGTKIYFSKGYNADNYYMMMDLDGSNLVNITQPNSFGFMEWALHFNTKGDKIIFHTSNWVGYGKGTDIVIADIDGTNWKRLTNSTGGNYNYAPFFHPSNSLIYYSFNINSKGNWNIYTMDQEGENKTIITDCGDYTRLSLSDFKSPIIDIYPNPSSNYINININEFSDIEILSISGELIFTENSSYINISNLKKGLYIVLVRDSDDDIIGKGKFIKE